MCCASHSSKAMTGKAASACPFSSNTAMMQGNPSSMSDTLHLPHIAALLNKIQDETVICSWLLLLNSQIV